MGTSIMILTLHLTFILTIINTVKTTKFLSCLFLGKIVNLKSLNMNKCLIVLVFCCSAMYGQTKNDIDGNQTEKIEQLLVDGRYKFNDYDLAPIDRNGGRRSVDKEYHPVTLEYIDITRKNNNSQPYFNEDSLPSFEIKKLNYLAPYKISTKDSTITLTVKIKINPISLSDFIPINWC